MRSIALAQLSSLFDVERCVWINLQRGGGEELAALASANGGGTESYPEVLDDLDETAALIEALDCVVSVDSTIAHLAGALGKRVLIMLALHSDWRWQRERETSPWYPSATLCRQRRSDDWEPVIERVAAELRAMK